MEWNDHKRMERNGMYLSKGNEWKKMEWNGIKYSLIPENFSAMPVIITKRLFFLSIYFLLIFFGTSQF